MATFRFIRLTGQLICILHVISVTIAMTVVPPLQTDLYKACEDGCPVDGSGNLMPNPCYIGHPSDCFKYVICQQTLNSFNILDVQVMPCPFGTMWKKDGGELSCTQTDLVECPNDPCVKDQYLTVHKVYMNNKQNCRMYYKCVNRRSKPACCHIYHSFDPAQNKCVNDSTCDSFCPLLSDETCMGAGVKNLHFNDNNCKTYFDCVNKSPIPICCPDNQSYDIFSSKCVTNASCTDPCPYKKYRNPCEFSDVTAYSLIDDNCLTYMKCSQKEPGKGKRHCCPKGKMFDDKQKVCVETAGSCTTASCPTGYTQDIDCKLKPAVGKNKEGFYINMDANFNDPEKDLLPCPAGLHFFVEKCGCDHPKDLAGKTVTTAPVGCQIAVHGILPSLENQGHGPAAIMKIGTEHSPGHDERGVGNMTMSWTGSDGINVPYFSTQTLRQLFIEVIFTPVYGTLKKQILVSSCSNYTKNQNSALEVSLMDDKNTTRLLTTTFIHPATEQMETISMPYMFNETYSYKLLYDGTKFGVVLTQRDNPSVSMSAQRPYSGIIYINRPGLRLHKCLDSTGESGFVGYMQEFKISKCLTDAMEAELNAIQSTNPV